MSSNTEIEFVTMMATIVAAVAACLAALWAKDIGKRQNEINSRFLSLQDYTAISVIPDSENGVLKVMNVGNTNLYIWGFDILNDIQRMPRPRLISVGTHDASYYWIPVPVIKDLSKKIKFDFKLYLTDEFDQKWISENGGEGEPIKIEKNNELVDAFSIKVWSYKMYRYDWSF